LTPSLSQEGLSELRLSPKIASPAARHPPALIVAAHGVFAVATILFALLAAVGSR